MGWTYLVVAGLLEIGWAVGLKYTEGFSTLEELSWKESSLPVMAVVVSSLP
jgi:quaternary ammonium compound-resistance protein SugE